MLNTILTVMLSNAAVVGVLALFIVVLQNWVRKPALIHGLWVIAFLKLVTPPLVSIPIPVLEAEVEETVEALTDEPSLTTAETPAYKEISVPFSGLAPLESPDTPIVIDPSPAGTLLAGESSEVLPAEVFIDHGDLANSDEIAQLGNIAVPPEDFEVATFRVKEKESAAETPEDPKEHFEEATALEPSFSILWLTVGYSLIGIWIVGSLTALFGSVRQIFRFERSLRHASPADESLERHVGRLAKRIGLNHPPDVYVLDQAVSPMLWGFGWPPRLLLPKQLLSSLDSESVETLILHELAHMRRGDHWVRVLELFCQFIYWWHPVVWWGRTHMRAIEEECCDALVVEHCHGPVYAKALVSTVDFLAGSRRDVPSAASGLGNLETLKRRLTMIMQGDVSARLVGLPRLLFLAGAVVGLSILPEAVQRSANGDESEEAVVSTEQPLNPPKGSENVSKPPTSAVTILGQEPTQFEKKAVGYPTSELEVRTLDLSPDEKYLAAGYGRWDTKGEVVIYDYSAKTVVKKFPVPKGVATVVFSPDGKYLAASYWNTQLIIWETENWDIVEEKQTGSKISRLAFSPDGKYLATANEAGELRMWEVGSWAATPEFTGDLFRFQKVTFSPDSKLLVAVGGQFKNPRFGRGLIFDVATKKQVAAFDSNRTVFAGVTVSPDGKEIATGEFGPAVSFWDAKTGKMISTLNLPGTVRELRYVSDDRLAVACGNGSIYLLKDNQLERQLAGHEREALSVAFTKDGKTLISGGEDATIRLWNPDTGVPLGTIRPVKAMEDTAEAVLSVSHSPDGRFVVSTHEDGSVRIREAETGRFLTKLEGHEDVVSTTVFSPDSQTLATASYDNTVKLWNVADGKLIRSFDGHTNWVFALAFSPDGKTLASGGYDKTVRLWNVGDGSAGPVMEGHTAAVRSAAFSPDGTKLVSGGSDRLVRTWDVKTGKSLQELKGHTGAVRAVAFSPDGRKVASASEDKSIRLWEVGSDKEPQVLNGHTGMVWSLAFSPRGRTLASGGFDQSVRIWNAGSGALLQTLSGHADVVTSVSYSPDSSGIVTGSYDKTLKLWPAIDPPVSALVDLKLQNTGMDKPIRFVAFTPNGKWMVTGNQDSTLRTWDLETGRAVYSANQDRGVTHGAVSPKGDFLVSGDYGKQLYLWELPTLKLITKLETGHEENVVVAVSPDGKTVAAGARDGFVTLWDIDSQTKLQELPKQDMPVEGLAFSPNGKWLASATGNWKEALKAGQVRLWDTSTWKPSEPLKGTHQKMRRVAFSPDGKTLIACGSQWELLVYDVATQKLTRRLSVGTEISAVAFLADSRTVLLSGYDGRVSLWNTHSGRRVVRYRGHQPANNNDRYVMDVAMSADGSVGASAGADGHVKLWPTASLRPKTARITLESEGAEAFHVALSPGGQKLAVSRANKTVKIYDTFSGQVLQEIEGLNTNCSGLAFSPDGKSIAGGLAGGKTFVWDAMTGEERFSFDAHTGGTRRVAYSPDGMSIATGGWDKTAAVWNAENGELRYRTKEQELAVSDVAFTPEEKLLIITTGSWRDWRQPGKIKAYNAANGEFIKRVGEHKLEIKDLAMDAGSWAIVSAGTDGVKVWNRKSGKLRTDQIAKGNGINAVEVSPDGNTIFVGTNTGGMHAFDLLSGNELPPMESHQQGVYGMTISNDGSILVSCSKDGTIKIWEGTRQPILKRTYNTREDPRETLSVVYSPDGRFLAVGGKDSSASLIDAKTRKVLREFTGHNGMVFRLAFNADATKLATASSDGTARIWDVATGKELAKYTGHGEALSMLRSVALSPDGKILAAGNWNGETYLWDIGTEKLLRKLEAQTLPVTGLSFLPDGKTLAMSTGKWEKWQEPGTIKLFDVETGKEVAEMKGHTADVKGLTLSKDGKILASYGSDKTVRIWDVPTRKLLRVYQHGVTVTSAEIFGSLMAVGDFRGSLTLVNLNTAQPVAAIAAHFNLLGYLAVSPDETTLATVGHDGYLKLWSTKILEPASKRLPSDTAHTSNRLVEKTRLWKPLAQDGTGESEEMTRLQSLKPHGEKVWFAVYSPDGKIAASGGEDGTVKLWNTANWQLLKTLKGHQNFTSHAAFSPDGSKLASVSWDSNVRLWNTETGELLSSTREYKGGCRQVAYSPDGNYIASASEDGFVRVYDDSLALHYNIDAELSASSLAFSSDSDHLAIGTGRWQDGKQGRIAVFRLSDGRKTAHLKGSEGYVFHLQFLKDGKRLLAANAGAGCAIWNIETGKMEERYRTQQDTRWVEISRDETKILATLKPGRVMIWNRNESEPDTQLLVSDKFVHSATFSPDGQQILVGDESGQLSVWQTKQPAKSLELSATK